MRNSVLILTNEVSVLTRDRCAAGQSAGWVAQVDAISDCSGLLRRLKQFMWILSSPELQMNCFVRNKFPIL